MDAANYSANQLTARLTRQRNGLETTRNRLVNVRTAILVISLRCPATTTFSAGVLVGRPPDHNFKHDEQEQHVGLAADRCGLRNFVGPAQCAVNWLLPPQTHQEAHNEA